ncbi:MAG: membrane protein insertase YidC [Verrucomicrobiota bacterium]
MDKKNTVLGIICIAAGIGVMFWQTKQLEEQRREELLNPPEAAESDRPMPADQELTGVDQGEAATPFEKQDEVVDLLAREVTFDDKQDSVLAKLPEEVISLSNEFIKVDFTNQGGAIKTVEFLTTKRGGPDDYIFNKDGYLPALSMSLAGPDGGIREFALPYIVDSKTAHEVTFAFKTNDGLTIRRSYSIANGEPDQDPYLIRHTTTFENGSGGPKALSTIYLNLGTARPISENQQPAYLNVGYFDGNDKSFTAINKLTGSSGFLGIGASQPRDLIEKEARIEWSSVKNQFFASVLSSERVGKALNIYPVETAPDGDGKPSRPGITGSVGYEMGIVAAAGKQSLDLDFYVGPKEFKRLQALGNEQDLVMQFGFLSFISKLLLSFMYAIHAVVPNWGVSIVLMTICIKLFFWPLTAKASKSQKRMASIQAPMAELKEKYKDNPQKMQQETLRLFKEHGVNPVAGCLPMLIQMPIFLGLFYMLRSASELRHEPFLWVSDLSQPDTLFEIGGFPFNLLPLLMGATMFVQMRMMPVSPTADPAQQQIFKFLPFVFLVFLYNFSSGLVLYWTVQNLLTILQQKITNSRPDEEPIPLPEAAGSAPKSKGGSPRTKSRKKK